MNGDFTQAKAYEETLAYLQSNPAPDVVYCENDNMCFGVMQAMDELGIVYGSGGVTLISFDAVRRALSYCKDGKIDLCAECNPLHGPRVRDHRTAGARRNAGKAVVCPGTAFYRRPHHR